MSVEYRGRDSIMLQVYKNLSGLADARYATCHSVVTPEQLEEIWWIGHWTTKYTI